MGMKISANECLMIGERLKECPNLSELEWVQLISSGFVSQMDINLL